MSHSCHILPFQPILRDIDVPSEPAKTTKHSPPSVFQVVLRSYVQNQVVTVFQSRRLPQQGTVVVIPVSVKITLILRKSLP